MLRAFFLISVSWLCLVPVVSAHNVNYASLPGVKLCVDPRSVQVTVNVPNAPEGVVEKIKANLTKSLHTTLTNYQVPFEEKEECKSEDGFILSGFHVGWLEDGQSPPSYVLVLATQVGKTPDVIQKLGAGVMLENLTFDYSYTGFVLESDLTKPFDEELPIFNEDTFIDLATAWWEGNPEGLPQVSYLSYLPQIMGGSMAGVFLILAIVFYFTQMRPKKENLQTESGTAVEPQVKMLDE
ncbi:MAG: hypothetical protein ACRCYY_07275 [Trueperaceae bacterium]